MLFTISVVIWNNYGASNKISLNLYSKHESYKVTIAKLQATNKWTYCNTESENIGTELASITDAWSIAISPRYLMQELCDIDCNSYAK